MTNSVLDIELFEGQDFELNLILESESGRLDLTGCQLSAQIRESYAQSAPLVANIATQITDARRGRIRLSLPDRDLRRLWDRPIHPRTPVAYYDVFITSASASRRYLVGGKVLYTAQPDEHQRHAPTLPEYAVPWWMDGRSEREPHFFAQGIRAFWQRCRYYLLFPLRQADPLTCAEALLNMMAWDRGIHRFADEPLALFRKRVKYAFINAQDAGEVAGFKRIFERLDIGWVDIHERQPNQPWDVITIELGDSSLAQNQLLLQTLIGHYGRTCRRYRFEVTFPLKVQLNHGRFDGSYQLIGASL